MTLLKQSLFSKKLAHVFNFQDIVYSSSAKQPNVYDYRDGACSISVTEYDNVAYMKLVHKGTETTVKLLVIRTVATAADIRNLIYDSLAGQFLRPYWFVPYSFLNIKKDDMKYASEDKLKKKQEEVIFELDALDVFLDITPYAQHIAISEEQWICTRDAAPIHLGSVVTIDMSKYVGMTGSTQDFDYQVLFEGSTGSVYFKKKHYTDSHPADMSAPERLSFTDISDNKLNIVNVVNPGKASTKTIDLFNKPDEARIYPGWMYDDNVLISIGDKVLISSSLGSGMQLTSIAAEVVYDDREGKVLFESTDGMNRLTYENVRANKFKLEKM